MNFELRIFEYKAGRSYYRDWIDDLDQRTAGIIERRVARLKLGNFGDVKPIGEGLSELRIDNDPGYRVYFGSQNREIILLLCGSDKSGQDRAIVKAKELWRNYKETK